MSDNPELYYEPAWHCRHNVVNATFQCRCGNTHTWLLYVMTPRTSPSRTCCTLAGIRACGKDVELLGYSREDAMTIRFDAISNVEVVGKLDEYNLFDFNRWKAKMMAYNKA